MIFFYRAGEKSFSAKEFEAMDGAYDNRTHRSNQEDDVAE